MKTTIATDSRRTFQYTVLHTCHTSRVTLQKWIVDHATWVYRQLIASRSLMHKRWVAAALLVAIVPLAWPIHDSVSSDGSQSSDNKEIRGMELLQPVPVGYRSDFCIDVSTNALEWQSMPTGFVSSRPDERRRISVRLVKLDL